ncbi:MAG: TIGR04211 family SH3 domain-containing protein [Deltaproteobacteria bacterium]
MKSFQEGNDMDLSIKQIGLVLMGIILVASPVCAETNYVSDEMHITFRSGPATDRKIIKLLLSGQALEVLQKEGEWTLVRLPNGTEGWVLHRYLTAAEPCDMVLERLSSKHTTLVARADGLDKENDSIKTRNKALAADLQSTQTDLKKTRKLFNDLKKESTAYLELKAEHQKATTRLSEQTKRVDDLENELARISSNFKLYLSGAAILVLGLILGLISRPQKQRSSLL